MSDMDQEEEEESLSEREIAIGHGDTYDVPNDEGATYRHVADWYFSVHRSMLNRHMELPANLNDLRTKQYVLYGRLVDVNASGKDIKIGLDNLQSWAIDRDQTLRGIWVETTTGVWYLLQQPCQRQPQINLSITIAGQETVADETLTATLPAQDGYHVEYRAKLGLVSNLTDLFDYGNAIFATKTPQILHKGLKPAKHAMAKYPGRPVEAFDLKLLECYPKFVNTHIQDILPENCKFLSSLNSKKATKECWSAQDFIASAEAAEARGGRYPWGAQIFRTHNPRVDIKWEFMDCHDDDAFRKSRAKRTATEMTVRAAEPPAKKAKTPPTATMPAAAISGETFGLNPNEEAGAKKKRVREEEKQRVLFDTGVYNSQRMEAAVEEMKPFLTPVPLLRLAKLADVRSNASYIKFVSPEKALEYTDHSMGKVQTWEHKLLLALAFMRAAEENTKFFKKSKFFRKKEGGASVILCETWMKEAMESAQTCCNIRSSTKGDSLMMIVFLTEIATLIRDCKYIDTAKKLDTLKNICVVHWEAGLSKMSVFASKMKSPRLVKAVIDARARLRKLRNDSQQHEPVEEQKKNSESPNMPAVLNIAKKSLASDEKEKIAREMRKQTLKLSHIACVARMASSTSSTPVDFAYHTMEKKSSQSPNMPAASNIAKEAFAADEKEKIAIERRKHVLKLLTAPIGAAYQSARPLSAGTGPGWGSSQKQDGEMKSSSGGWDSQRRVATTTANPNWRSGCWDSRKRDDSEATDTANPNWMPTWSGKSWSKTSEGNNDHVRSHSLANTVTDGAKHTPNENGNIPPSTGVDDRASARSEASLPSISAAHLHDNQSGARAEFQIILRGLSEPRGQKVQRTENNVLRREEGRAPAPWFSSRAESLSRDSARPPQALTHNLRAGRGRGRGGDINKPAWMTINGGGNFGSGVSEEPLPAPYVRESVNAGPLNEHSSIVLQVAANAASIGNLHEPQPDSLSRGRGRGRARTLPAWKTRDGGDNVGLHSHNSLAPALGVDRQTGSDGGAVPAVDRRPALGVLRMDPPDERLGRGRGRGRGQTLPAWMTRQQLP